MSAAETVTADLITELRRKGYELARANAEVFRSYESLHRAKGTPDGEAKADRNAEMAEMNERLMLAFLPDKVADHGRES